MNMNENPFCLNVAALIKRDKKRDYNNKNNYNKNENSNEEIE